MSLTGELYKISKQELGDFLKSKKNSFDHLKDSIDLSYFAIDYLEILKTYSGMDQKEVGRILEGLNSLEVEDGYLGYSQIHEVSKIKSETLDKISENTFVGYLDRAEEEKHLLGYYYSIENGNRDFFIRYFNNIKRIYEETTNEGKCLLHRIG